MIAVGCDHGGLNLKNAIVKYLEDNNIEYKDFGTYTDESVDYPVYGYKVAKEIAEGRAEKGVLCCGTGIGISMAANKVKGIRAAVCTNEFMAEFTRKHNDSHIICMGGRVIDEKTAVRLTDIFLHTEFEGGRHQNRINMITDIENNNFKE